MPAQSQAMSGKKAVTHVKCRIHLQFTVFAALMGVNEELCVFVVWDKWSEALLAELSLLLPELHRSIERWSFVIGPKRDRRRFLIGWRVIELLQRKVSTNPDFAQMCFCCSANFF